MQAGTDEEIEVHEFEFDEALAMMIVRRDIIDAKTIAGPHFAAAPRGAILTTGFVLGIAAR